MESRDHVQPEPERARSSDESEFTLGAGEAARAEQPELYQLLRGIADDVAPGMRADFYPQVMKRATAIRRRRRALRASSLTAVLAAAVMLGPAIAHEFRARGGQTTAAPSAVVDMASAYPAAEPSAPVDVPMAAAAPAPAADSRPANALNWPARGVTPPSDAVSLATSYMEVHAKPGSTVAVTPLWAQIDDDATVVAEPRTAAEGSAARDTQKTIDGVAVFPRTRTLVKGRYADTIQVRDAKNVALTPPKAWSAGDIALTGAASRWVSTAPEWVQIPALSKAPPTTQVPPATRAPAPASSSLRPTVPSGKAPTP